MTMLAIGDLSCFTASAAETRVHHQHEVICMTSAGSLVGLRLTPQGTVAYDVTGYYDAVANCWALFAPDGSPATSCP
jgi:hypothetical protein